MQATGGEHYIETVWGRGYVLKEPDASVDRVAIGTEAVAA